MILLPRSLLARSFLLIVILIVLSLTASVVIFRQAQQEPHAKQMAQLVVSVVNLTRAAVLSAAPEWRPALLAELAGSEGLRLHMADDSDVIEPLPAHPAEMRLMMKKVRESLGNNTRFASERNGEEALWVSFFIGHEEFWIALPKDRVEYPVYDVLFPWGVLVFVFALPGAYFAARQVSRPLMKIAQAALQVGQGTTPQPLPESGAREIVTVSRAINQMSADLAANERERALVLAGISHDLRTPLARVRIAAEFSADESLREGLVADVEQMDAVIQQFLDYARFDESEARTPTDLKPLVQEVAQRLSAQAGSMTLDLHEVSAIPLRPLLIKRALGNLLDNAIKHGGGEVTVQLRQAGGNIILSVADHGSGIPLSQHATVRRPFIRLESARSNSTGSGLGLAIVERAARLNDGELILADNENGGLVAKLVLPCT